MNIGQSTFQNVGVSNTVNFVTNLTTYSITFDNATLCLKS